MYICTYIAGIIQEGLFKYYTIGTPTLVIQKYYLHIANTIFYRYLTTFKPTKDPEKILKRFTNQLHCIICKQYWPYYYCKHS